MWTMNEAYEKLRRTGGFVIKTSNRKKTLKEWGTHKAMTISLILIRTLLLPGEHTNWYDMIYLSTAIGFTNGGSITVHIYTQTVHTCTTTQITTEQHK
jgi:hypothetical protein